MGKRTSHGWAVLAKKNIDLIDSDIFIFNYSIFKYNPLGIGDWKKFVISEFDAIIIIYFESAIFHFM